MNLIRTPQVAGYFYPSNPEKLKNEIIQLVESIEQKKEYKNIFGLVAPHAGYMYSGQTAAYAYNLIKGKSYETVIVISPSHSEYFPGISVYKGDAYKTPLGIVEVDNVRIDKLISGSKYIYKGLEGHRKEHALEVQLPFLQSTLKDFKIIPIVIGDQKKMFVDELAEQLVKITDERTLVIASSDLSHFYSADDADKLDAVIEKNINDFDFQSLQKNLDSGNCEACGGGPIVALMKAASLKNYKHAEVLVRTDSGKITGDKSEVVGYLSAVIYN